MAHDRYRLGALGMEFLLCHIASI